MDNINDDGVGFNFGEDSELNRLFKMLNDARGINTPRKIDNESGKVIPNRIPDEKIEMFGRTFNYVIKSWINEGGDEFKVVDFITLSNKELDMETVQKIIDDNGGFDVINMYSGEQPKIGITQRLVQAVNEQKYELAIQLRDEINNHEQIKTDLKTQISEAIITDDLDKADILLHQLRKIINDFF